MEKEEKKLEEKKETKKLSYEELNNIAVQLSKEKEWLTARLQEAEAALRSIDRLNILMRIIDINNRADKFHFSDDFISSCISEIEEMVTLPKEEPKTEENTGGN